MTASERTWYGTNGARVESGGSLAFITPVVVVVVVVVVAFFGLAVWRVAS